MIMGTVPTCYDCAKSICNTELRLRRIDQFEDKEEGRSIVNLMKGVATKEYREGTLSDILYRHIMDYDDEGSNVSLFYVSSFCTIIDWDQMWKQYGDSSKGCCIVIDTELFPKIIKFIKVIYKNQEKEQVIRNMILTLDNYKNHSEEFYTYYLDYICGTLRYMFKGSEYEDENEVRIILDKGNSNEIEEPYPHSTIDISSGITMVILGSKSEVKKEIAIEDFPSNVEIKDSICTF